MSGGSVNQSASIECSMLQGRQPWASVYIIAPLPFPLPGQKCSWAAPVWVLL
jgi:hypothetical protein